MGWSLGHDSNWGRDIGYAVPAYCDHPNCDKEIDRGLAHVCGGEPYGGDKGCGLYFCGEHLLPTLCEKCTPRHRKPFPAKPEHPRWVLWKTVHKSWAKWRRENPQALKKMQQDFIGAEE